MIPYKKKRMLNISKLRDIQKLTHEDMENDKTMDN